MKTTLVALAFVVALSLSAVAATSKNPAIHRAGSDVPDPAAPPTIAPPALCNPCLFYGGDLNPSS